MKLARRNILLGLGGALVLASAPRLLLACRNDGTNPPDRGKVLSDLTTNVILPSYTDAATDARSLEVAVGALRDAPTADSLAAARTAWRKARASWKATDGFAIDRSPAADLLVTAGAIDTPPDPAKIEALAVDSSPIDADAVSRIGANQRGFGGVEVLLFDPARDDATMLAAFGTAGARRGTLAALVATELRTRIEAVRDAWLPGGTNYGGQLSTAGRGSTIFTTEHAGVDAVINALVAAAELVIARHLAQPLGTDKTPVVPKPELVESPRADASIDDLLAELGSLEATYLGRRGAATGLAISDAVADRSPTADAHMKDAFTQAKAAVQAIPGPLRTAVTDRRDPVMAAYTACRSVKRVLSSEVAAALGTSLGFTVSDGD